MQDFRVACCPGGSVGPRPRPHPPWACTERAPAPSAALRRPIRLRGSASAAAAAPPPATPPGSPRFGRTHQQHRPAEPRFRVGPLSRIAIGLRPRRAGRDGQRAPGIRVKPEAGTRASTGRRGSLALAEARLGSVPPPPAPAVPRLRHSVRVGGGNAQSRCGHTAAAASLGPGPHPSPGPPAPPPGHRATPGRPGASFESSPPPGPGPQLHSAPGPGRIRVCSPPPSLGGRGPGRGLHLRHLPLCQRARPRSIMIAPPFPGRLRLTQPPDPLP
jgi:hypothetical protein